MQLASIYTNGFLIGSGSDMFLNDPRRHRDDVVALPVFDQPKRLKSLHYIICSDCCQLSYLLDGQMGSVLPQEIQQHPCPVATVAHLQAQDMSSFVKVQVPTSSKKDKKSKTLCQIES